MSTVAENNKRIAKNTAFLYFRMLLIMLVSLYTSRVVLQTLGVVDFGIYNVVGGVVTMLAFFNSSLNTATQRYMNYEMGKNNAEGLAKVFSMSFIGFCIIAVITAVLAESVGLWFIYNRLVIPPDRLNVAVIVFHLSVLTFIVNILLIPYSAAIIAHEHMSIYAYISIAEVVLKLLLVFLLQVIDCDKLILFGVMVCVVSCLVALSYRYYCVRQFRECRLKWVWDKSLLKGLFSFSGWMLSGTMTNMLSTQGVNMLINMFFGPAMNAARAVAMQVNGAVGAFEANFMTAVRPQIVKSYAQEDWYYMYRLVFSSSKCSFYLLFVLVLPILFNTHSILALWLKEVPDYAALFTQLVLIDLLINAAYGPIAYVSQASGKIRDYQIVISVGFILIAVLTWLAFKMKFPVEYAFIITIAIDIIGLFARLWVLQRTVQFPVLAYFKKVMSPVMLVFTLSLLSAYFISGCFDSETFVGMIGNAMGSCLVAGGLIWIIGMEQAEKQMVIKGISKLTNKIK